MIDKAAGRDTGNTATPCCPAGGRAGPGVVLGQPEDRQGAGHVASRWMLGRGGFLVGRRRDLWVRSIGRRSRSIVAWHWSKGAATAGRFGGGRNTGQTVTATSGSGARTGLS